MSIKIIKYGNPDDGSQEGINEGNISLVMRVTAQAKSLTPVDSGTLRGSIMWRVPGKDGGHEEGNVLETKPDKDSGLVGTATEYAGYVEFGTRKQQAQPYLRPAITLEVFGPNGMNTLKKEVIEQMKKALSKGRKTYEF